ncbi:MAG TPA: sigma-70 family RNA polymerase sigma factor [Rhodothermales bacterium]
MTSSRNVTDLLLQARSGDRGAFDSLFPLVYGELREVAHQRLLGFRSGETLNTTALIHEVYLRLVDQTRVSWENRAHFFAVASKAMRNVVIDHARAWSAQKRGGGNRPLDVDEVQIAADDRAFELVALDEALTRLTAHDERLGRLVEYRFFGGLEYEEIAEVTGWSVPTLKRDWRRARTWLYEFMQGDDS